MEKSDWIPLGAFIGLSAVAFWQDEEITEHMQYWRSREADLLLGTAKHLGEGWGIFGFSGLFYIAGLTLDKRCIYLGTYILEGAVISGIYVSAVKFIAGRARPYTGRGSMYYKPFNLSTAYTSFYSGHTTEAFTLASVIAHFFNNTAVSIAAYSLSTMTALERIYNNKHWASDTLVGAGLGFLIGRQIIRLNKNCQEISVDKDSLKISFKLKEF